MRTERGRERERENQRRGSEIKGREGDRECETIQVKINLILYQLLQYHHTSKTIL